MPKYQHRIETHRLFLIEQRGDTLIVFPKGDPAGFANLNFNVEHAALMGLINQEKYKNVLVDLSGSNYFGAKILGAFSDWSSVVEAKGGKFALCELSDDMKELLKIFHFENRWQIYDTREQGVKATVKETPLETMRHHWKHMAFVGCALLFVGLSFLPWQEYYIRYLNEKDYATVQGIWAEMQALKTNNAPPPEWRKLESRANRELTPLLPKLERRAGRLTLQAQAAQHLFMAVKHNILKHLLVKRSRLTLERPMGPKKELFWQMTAVHMEKARLILNGQDPRGIDFPKYVAEQQPVLVDESGQPIFDPHSDLMPHGESGRLLLGPNSDVSRHIPPAIAEKPGEWFEYDDSGNLIRRGPPRSRFFPPPTLPGSGDESRFEFHGEP